MPAPWPKLWQNLRSTRETELFERYPAHVAAAWIGNTVAVALEHYTQMRDDYYTQATAEPTLPRAAHALQSGCAPARTASHGDPEETAENVPNSACSRVAVKGRMGGKGLEPLTSSV